MPRLVALGDVVRIIGGGTPARSNSEYYGGDIPWVTPKDMKTWDICDSLVRLTQAGVDNSTTRVAPKNSVLVVIRSGVLKHTLPVAINRRPVAINQDMKALICSDEILPDYLARYLKGQSNLILSWVRATTADNFPIDRLRKLKIPLPSTQVQARGVALLSSADDLRAKRRASGDLIDKLAESVFFDMFGDVACNDRGWREGRTLGDVADVVSGITKGRKADGPFRRVPYLAVANVQDMRLDLAVVKDIDATASEIAKYSLKRDDLLLTEGGDPDKLGRGTLWQDELPLCIHQNHIFRVRLRKDVGIRPVFLEWLIASARGRRYFLRSAKQTTGIASINATQLRGFPLLMPPLDVQDKFSMFLTQLQVQRISSQTQLVSLDGLFASLQRDVFAGTL